MSSMTLFFVAAGGAVGAALRYLVGQFAARAFGTGFPWGTFSVNLIGSLLMGLAAGALIDRVDPKWAAFATTGVLGGFTTFSTFSLDAALLIERGESGLSLLYMAGSVVAGVALLFIGLWLGRSLVS
ncbi:fluoride efflux transporter CrcB [Paracoccaceae bacterium GXU_MW_L88]